MFLERGYAGATIPRIAAEAGVAVETIYRSADGKAGLLAATVQAALAGGAQRAEVYDSLVTGRGWTPQEYREWLAEALILSLLPPDEPG